MLVALLAAAVAVLGACSWLCWRRSRAAAAGEPPRLASALPVLGHSYGALWTTANGMLQLLETMAKDSLEVGGVGTTSFGTQKAYIITDPEVAKTVLNTCMEKDAFYNSFVGAWFRRGLFVRPFNGYMERRKLVMPGFSPKALDGFYDIIDAQAKLFTDRLSKLAGVGPVNLETNLAMFTLQTIMLTQLGMTEEDVASLQDKMVDCLTATQDMLKLIIERFVRFWCHVPWIYKWTHYWKKEQVYLKMLHRLSEEVMRRRMLALKGTSKTFERVDKKNQKQTPIFLDLLLQEANRGAIDLTEVQEEIDGLMFAGHDTSAGALQFACVLLAAHPEVQETLYIELKEVLGDTEHITKQHLSSLKYTEAVLKETMRLYPPVAFNARLVDKDVRIEQFTLRAGSKVFVFPLGLHRRPEWGDGAQFRPARWLAPHGVPAAAAAAYMPFSSGRRSCLGKLYSMAVMKTALARALRRCRLLPAAPRAPPAPLRLEYRILLKPVSGHHIIIELRE